MKTIENRFPAGLAISSGILLLMVFFIGIFSYISVIMLNSDYPNVSFYSSIVSLFRLWPLILLAIVMFCRGKNIFAGIVFAYYSFDQLIGGLIANSIVGMLAKIEMHWNPSAYTLLHFAFWVLLAIACFGSKKQLLRKVRWLFIVLPLLLVPVLVVVTISGQSGLQPSDIATILFSQFFAQGIIHLPHLLIGLTMFCSYPKKVTVPAQRCCSACGQSLDDNAKFCIACGNPVE